MAEKKMTMTEQYEAIKALLNGETVENYSTAKAIEFIDGRIAQVAKKNATPTGERKPTKTQLENEGIKEQIVAVLATAEKPMSIGEMQKADPSLPESSQKMTSMLTQLVKAYKVERTEVKGRAYFALPTKE